MTQTQNDMTPRDATAALAWLAEMGADEIIGETPVNRIGTVPAPKREPVPRQEPVRPAAAAPPPFAGDPQDGRALAAQCQSLADIEAALQRFDACPLKKTATQLCYCDGNPAADVMLIGEAPGRDEDVQGKPFVGRSGQLLDKMLAAIGLSRTAEDHSRSVFITNVIFWRPPGNRPVTPQEVEQCLPFMLRAIEILQPRYILGFGSLPAQALLKRTDTLMAMRGKWFEVKAAGRSIPMISTFSPRMLLQQRAQKRLAWRDLLTLQERMRSAS